MVWKRRRTMDGEETPSSNASSVLLVPTCLDILTSLCSCVCTAIFISNYARASASLSVVRRHVRFCMRVHFDLLPQEDRNQKRKKKKKRKHVHQSEPHFSSLFDAFKMLITALLCARSNANALFYCHQVGTTVAFAYLMSVSLACTEEPRSQADSQ